MRICHYPGRVVDATLAIDQKSPMEMIYQNNWLNADKTIKTIGKKSAAAQRFNNNNNSNETPKNHFGNETLDRKYFNHSSGSSAAQSSSDDENRRTSISSLGRYQVTLEEMQKLDLNQSNELFKKTMRNLNGYKPSTIRQKHRRNYDGWDEFKEKAIAEESKNNHNGNWQPNDYKYDAVQKNQVLTIPKVKRSQTVRYSSSMLNGNTKPNTTNILNVFNQQIDEKTMKMPTATINKNFNRFKRNNLPLNSLNNVNDDTIKSNANQANENTITTAKNPNDFIIPSNFSQFTMKSNGSIKTELKPNGTCDNSAATTNGKSKKKPLFRAKSVRINPTPLEDVYFDRMTARTERNGTNGISTNCDKQQCNGFNETMNVKQKKLPRLTSIMKKRPNVIPEQNDEQTQSKPILDQWINYQKTATKKDPAEDGKYQISIRTKDEKSQKDSSTSSLSSISSGCGDGNSDFSIPRPRLIVPVHTYARRRRTGNLIQSQAGACERINGNAVVIEQPRNSNNRKNGKSFSYESLASSPILFCFVFFLTIFWSILTSLRDKNHLSLLKFI